MLNDGVFLTFKEASLYYMLAHLEYYAIRNHTLGEGLYLLMGPWNHYIHLTLVHNSRVVQEEKKVNRFFFEGCSNSDVTAWSCWYVRVGGTVQ